VFRNNDLEISNSDYRVLEGRVPAAAAPLLMAERETLDSALELKKLHNELELLQCQVRPMAGCVFVASCARVRGLRATAEHAGGGRRRVAAAHQIGVVFTGGGCCELMS
jgi:hypothetical protein